MFGAFFSWLSGGAIKAIGGQLNAAYQARLAAKNDRERIKADIRIKQLEAQQNVLIAEQGSRMTRWVRPAFAAIFWVYLVKVIIWDKVFGLGTTDPLGGYLQEIMMIIIGAYFLTRPFEKRRRK